MVRSIILHLAILMSRLNLPHHKCLAQKKEERSFRVQTPREGGSELFFRRMLNVSIAVCTWRVFGDLHQFRTSTGQNRRHVAISSLVCSFLMPP
jgi:hypothetical protein